MAEIQPYTAGKPARGVREDLRARIPGWGADLDPKDRPSVAQGAARYRDRRALGLPRAPGGELAAGAVDRAQVPDPRVRNLHAAQGRSPGSCGSTPTGTAKGVRRTG